MTDLFPRYAPEYYSELTSHSVGLEKLQNCMLDGKLLCVPCNDLMTERAIIIARKDLMEMYAPNGFETLEDYGDFLARVKNNSTVLVPGDVNPSIYFKAYLQGNGFVEFSATYFYKKWDSKFWDEYYSMERTEEFKTAYYMLKEWYDMDYIKGNIDTVEYMSMGGLSSILTDDLNIDFNLNRISSKYEFVIDPLYMEEPHCVFIATRGVSVSKTSTCPERVMMFLEWMHSSQEAYDLFKYGVENRNYILNGDKISFTSDELEIQPINDNLFLNFFKDFRYERLYEYQPDDYKEIYRDACLKNTVTNDEMMEKILGISIKDKQSFNEDLETIQYNNDEYERVSQSLEKYFDNMKTILKEIGRGFFRTEPEEIIQLQKETGIDEWLEYNINMFKKLRDIQKK